jgi:hypothetical protein
MKRLLRYGLKSTAIILVAIAMFLIGGPAARGQSNDNDGCSDSTLKGDYAFTVSGQIFLPSGLVIQREGVAMANFDGEGKFKQVDFVLSSPNAPAPPGTSPVDPVTGFHTEEVGIYRVHPDCTGTYTIKSPDVTTSMGSSIPGAIIVVQFVLSNEGRSIHTVVSSLTPAGAPGPVPALIRAEGHKLGSVPEFERRSR